MDVEYVPRNWAKPFHQGFQRFSTKVIHRRGGKSVSDILQHQRAATDDQWERRRLKYLAALGGFALTETHLKELLRARQYGVVLPTRVQAKFAAWEHVKYYASFVPGAKTNESDLKVDYPGGHTLQLFGADKPDAFRGGRFSGISFDEYGMMRPNIFSEVVSKNLADHLGYAIFSGTIKGRNQLFKNYEANKNDPECFTIWQDIAKSLREETGATIIMLQQAMLDDQKLIAKGIMADEEFQQEWFLSTEAAIKGAIYGKALAEMRKQHRVRPLLYDPQFPVHDVWDLGAGLNLSVGCFQRIMREIRMVDYLQSPDGEGMDWMIRELQRKPYIYGKHFAPHDIMGKDLSSGKTRFETSKKLGWHFEIVPDIGVREGINAGRLAMARLWADEGTCKDWLEAMPFYRLPWDDRLQAFRDEPVHDWCVTAETKVLTREGAVAISELPQEGDVWTPCGWKRYHSPRLIRSNAQLVAVTFSDGLTVNCTPEHLFLTPANAWRSAGDLRMGSLIQSSSIQSRSTSTASCTVSTRVRNILRKAASAFISGCGQLRLDRFQLVATFITRTMTPARIDCGIWSVSPLLSTCPIRGMRSTPTVELAQAAESLQPSGIAQRPDACGTPGWCAALRAGRSGGAWRDRVRSAVAWWRWSIRSVPNHKNIAAPVAARRRFATATLAIASVSSLDRRGDVWCLSVPDGQAWCLENGAVTHNSSHPADMWRYTAVVEEKMTNDKVRPRQQSTPPSQGGKNAGLGWMAG